MSRVAGGYVHGYDEAANARLNDQASALEALLHTDTRYAAGSRVLEAGCGVGAQTVPLARNSPDATFTSVDISAASLEQAAARVAACDLTNVEFLQCDLFDLPFEPCSFDAVFVCFLLEHVADPIGAIAKLKAVLRPGGTITVVEGDHGSTFFHPHSEAAQMAVAAQVELQRRAGGNANIGRELFPILERSGFRDIHVSPRMVYVDGNSPDLAQAFTRRTFTAMIAGVREHAVEAGIIDAQTFDEGVMALDRAAEPDGVFCYTFFKATAFRPEALTNRRRSKRAY